MARHFMNPAQGKHFGDDAAPAAEAKHAPDGEGDRKAPDSGQKPDIHIQSHAKGHTVHIHHSDGRSEQHEHAKGDAEGISEHIHQHLGGAEGQDHGFSSDEGMENEFGAGPGV